MSIQMFTGDELSSVVLIDTIEYYTLTNSMGQICVFN